MVADRERQIAEKASNRAHAADEKIYERERMEAGAYTRPPVGQLNLSRV